MAWDTEMENDREVLRSIIGWLFALAVLADRASTLSHPVRCRVLDILRNGLTVLLDFVSQTASDLGRPTPLACLTTSMQGDEPEDATRLAQHLRALAITLAYLVVQAGCFAYRRINPEALKRLVIALLATHDPLLPAPEPAFHDTS